MKLFDILKLQLPALTPEECKIHLAGWNGRDDPLDIFIAGEFQAWQNWQGNKNFERPYIVSLIKMGEASKWLFAGVYATHGCIPVTAKIERPWDKFNQYQATPDCTLVKQAVRYETEKLPEFDALTGRLIIEFERTERQSYRNAETLAERLVLSEIKPVAVSVEEFPGFTKFILLKRKLDFIIKQQNESWKAALSSVAGVYLITDTKTGRHYVGSAYGTGGIWARWTEYSITGHGENKQQEAILQSHGFAYSLNFQFSILETADTNSSREDVLMREAHWKEALCSHDRYGGYNAN